jgi:hypothetical protein
MLRRNVSRSAIAAANGPAAGRIMVDDGADRPIRDAIAAARRD